MGGKTKQNFGSEEKCGPKLAGQSIHFLKPLNQFSWNTDICIPLAQSNRKKG
jgi:hypothetical protein